MIWIIIGLYMLGMLATAEAALANIALALDNDWAKEVFSTTQRVVLIVGFMMLVWPLTAILMTITLVASFTEN